jgi:hypothetical protein
MSCNIAQIIPNNLQWTLINMIAQTFVAAQSKPAPTSWGVERSDAICSLSLCRRNADTQRYGGDGRHIRGGNFVAALLERPTQPSYPERGRDITNRMRVARLSLSGPSIGSVQRPCVETYVWEQFRGGTYRRGGNACQ